MTIPLVLVHGFEGSTLLSPSGQTYWINKWETLGLKASPLGLPLEWDNNGFQMKDSLVPGGIIDSVTLIPYLIEKQYYKKLLDSEKNFNRPFHTFAYDWRRDNLETLVRFEIFMKELHQKYGTKIQIVAHSMGGLIALPFINENPELVHSVFLAGVSFTGGVGVLQDLNSTQIIGLNSKLLSSEVISTFPSVYTSFPLDSQDKLKDEQGEIIKVDFFSVSDWQKNRWGLFSKSDENTSQKERFLKIALERAKQFRLLQVAKPIQYPPITVVSSCSHPTIVTGIRTGSQDSPQWNFEMAEKYEGDGRVCQKDTLLPNGIPYTIQKSQFDHASLLSDPEVIKLIRDSVHLN